MADLPGGLGFGPTGGDRGDDGDGEGPFDPFAGLLGPGFDPSDIGAAFQRIGRMLDYSGPVNWRLADETARSALGAAGDPAVPPAEAGAVAEALRLAELWLDPVTVLPAGGAAGRAWTRREWLEATADGWRALVEPLATRAVEAMSGTLPSSVPPEMAAMAGPLAGMLQKLGGAMFAAQVGQGLARLAQEVVSAGDVGVPLSSPGTAALVPANVASFGAGLGVADDQVRLYLALREAAHQRLFAHVTWLRGRVVAAVDEYARGIVVDTSALEEQLGSLDPTDPTALQQAVESGMFEPPETEEQKLALARLETLLALVEGWVDHVVAEASGTLPDAERLREAMRRRRATGGPAERTFANLVGLELRPRRVREASALWATLREHRGPDGRDAVWGHPDLLPTTEDLDDPEGFVTRGTLDLAGLEDLPSAPDQGDDGPPST